jgi:hypothetical protein
MQLLDRTPELLEDAISFRFELAAGDGLMELVGQLNAEMARNGQIRGNRRHWERNLGSVVANLYAAWSRAPAAYVAYSRDSHAYGQSRYNPLQLTRQLPHVVDALAEAGHVEALAGFFDRRTRQSRRARMRGTLPLLMRFQELQHAVVREVEREVIELRQAARTGRQTAVDYEDTETTNRWREQVQDFNRTISDGDIRLGVPQGGAAQTPLEAGYAVDLSATKLVRIFSNGRWDEGGRLYGGWWQRLPNRTRRCITIDRQPTVELDFKSLQPVIAYLSQGIDYWRETTADPYRIDGVPWHLRSVVKTAYLIALNARTRRQGLQALTQHIRDLSFEDQQEVQSVGGAVGLLDGIMERHPTLQPLWLAGRSGWLQHLDSEIAVRVLELCGEAGVVCLPIHDSFIVRTDHEDTLEDFMREAFQEVIEEHTGVGYPECLISRD